MNAYEYVGNWQDSKITGKDLFVSFTFSGVMLIIAAGIVLVWETFLKFTIAVSLIAVITV